MEFTKDLNPVQVEKYWTKKAQKVLLGKTIVKVHYLPKEKANDWGWYKRPIVFTLSDETKVIVQMDDEGNDGGVLWSLDPHDQQDDLVMPVL